MTAAPATSKPSPRWASRLALAVVLVAFGGFGSREVTLILLLTILLVAVAFVSFKVARGA